ncbi:hypothetical protein [Methylotuvimicrobium buryatense]|uniref:hypothetical protein n=1 Tax=Methylotuvimicrobium buryatense TaxID=95641 RepID=UPI001FCC3AA2|nr:hypothetical protein [Methylotuvimicrobium buryatense]
MAANIFFAVALPCEAKPLVAHFGLKKDTAVRAFAMYRNESIYLTVTGPGKSAMAAGLAYTQAVSACLENALFINVGVAGHRTHDIGSAWTINKVSDADTGRNYYPMPVYGLSCPATSLLTGSKPQFDYNHEHLCDMEASAFFETAARFSTGELIQCLKVVSDNRLEPGRNLDPKVVEQLIGNNIGLLGLLLDKLEERAKLVNLPEAPNFEYWIRQYRFTISEQNRLKNLLSRFSVLTGKSLEPADFGTVKSGKELLAALESRLDKIKFEL